jgi:hypothetical protein
VAEKRKSEIVSLEGSSRREHFSDSRFGFTIGQRQEAQPQRMAEYYTHVSTKLRYYDHALPRVPQRFDKVWS